MSSDSSTIRNIEDQREEEWKPGKGEYLVVLTLCLLSLIVALDATILVPALPIITKELNGSTTDAFWAGSSYLLTNALFQPIIVAFSDDFGRRPLLFLSVGLFTLGTIICCVAQDFPTLLAGRAIQGIGGSGCISLNNVILTDIVPMRQRPVYIALTGLSWAVGSVTGPLIGGAVAQHSTWRWVFYLNFPFCAIGLAIIPLSVKLSAKRPSVSTRLLRFDWIGMVAFTASASSFLIGITWGGSQFPWGSWHTVVPIIVGVAGLVAAGVWEVYGTERPFIRVSLLCTRSQIAAYFCAILQGIVLFCSLYSLPIFYEGVKGYTPTRAGVGIIPMNGSLLPFGIITGAIIRRTGHFRWAIWSGWAISILSYGLLIMWSPETRVYAWVLMLILVGLGQGLVLIALNICTQSLAPSVDVGYAAAMYTFMRGVGMCIGVSLSGTILQNTLKSHLEAQGLDPSLAHVIEGILGELRHSPMRKAFGIAIAQSFDNISEFLVGIAALAFFVSLLIKSSSVDREFNPEHVLETSRDEKPTMEKQMSA
ncbi:MFS transporter L2 [Cladobotryum mycophilum]|uniref:MFS transporter L2 n=1 Tax=Cladobotryum mycophilum TaxID=491253 RepID=A0ABR0SW79_9HYPO